MGEDGVGRLDFSYQLSKRAFGIIRRGGRDRAQDYYGRGVGRAWCAADAGMGEGGAHGRRTRRGKQKEEREARGRSWRRQGVREAEVGWRECRKPVSGAVGVFTKHYLGRGKRPTDGIQDLGGGGGVAEVSGVLHNE